VKFFTIPVVGLIVSVYSFYGYLIWTVL